MKKLLMVLLLLWGCKPSGQMSDIVGKNKAYKFHNSNVWYVVVDSTNQVWVYKTRVFNGREFAWKERLDRVR